MRAERAIEARVVALRGAVDGAFGGFGSRLLRAGHGAETVSWRSGPATLGAVMSAPTSSLLVEIGVEELPSSFVEGAIRALPEIVTARLAEARLRHGAVRALGTPRRLAVVVEGVATRQEDVDDEVVGPPETAAFKDGQPTKAAEAFATKLGVAVGTLRVADRPAEGRQKAGRYVVGRRALKGSPATEVLGTAIAAMCAAIPFKKSMRWGTGSASFGRPVQWLVALLGKDSVDVSFAGVRSGRVSRGHRFLSPDAFELKDADGYVDELRARHVVVDKTEREETMMVKVAAAAKAAGGVHDPAALLVVENASLVEEPHVITGSFDRDFLVLPAAVIRAVARGHQRYFTVEKSEDELLPHYITVVNTALDVPTITRGNDIVMRSRLSDARFFFEEDKKVKLDDRVEKLKGIVFHNKLGTVREKVTRIERLAKSIGERAGSDSAGDGRGRERLRTSASSTSWRSWSASSPSCRARWGARTRSTRARPTQSPTPCAITTGLPIATDEVAPSDVSAAVALADRLDTLAGCFAVGLEPTGAADPYALRRACIAVLRTCSTRGRPTRATRSSISWRSSMKHGPRTTRQPRTTPPRCWRRCRRLRPSAFGASWRARRATPWLTQSWSRRQPTARRLSSVTRSTPWPEPKLSTRSSANSSRGSRSRRPSPSACPASASSRRRSFTTRPSSTKPDDAVIVKVVRDVDHLTRELHDEASVRKALAATEELAQRVDAIFVSTLVNDPADPKTPLRLSLLSYGAMCMLRLADFSRLG